MTVANFDPFIDPEARLDYGIDWTAWIGSRAPGQTIASATWEIPVGLNQDLSYTTIIGNVTQTRVYGATVGESYTLTCHAVFSDGQEDNQSITLRGRER